MATEIWKAKKEVQDMMRDLVAKNHPDLALTVDEIVVLFREKATKKGGKVILGSSKKAPSLLSILSDIDCKFIIEVAADEWQNLRLGHQKALLDHHLCALRVEEDDKTGDYKYFVAPPDIGYYFDEYERHGDWRPKDDASTTTTTATSTTADAVLAAGSK